MRPEEWNAVVDSLNDLYQWLFGRWDSVSFGTVEAAYGHFEEARIDSLSAGSASFDSRPTAEGRPVLLDGDPISVYGFYETAVRQITEAIDASALLSRAVSDLDATVAGVGAIAQAVSDIRAYAARETAALETHTPLLADTRDYARDIRDAVVKIDVDGYGRVGVRIVEPLDALGRVPVAPPSELLDEFRPVYATASVAAADNTAGLSVTLYKGGRPFVDVYYSLGGTGSVYVEVSVDGIAWRALDSFLLTAGGSGTKLYQGVAYPYVRARTDATGVDVTLEVVASR